LWHGTLVVCDLDRQRLYLPFVLIDSILPATSF
jgi:hypothetical protein